MDRLRALEYCLSAARTKSLSAAARQHAVSVQAVSKLVTALEADLGIELFQRSARGLLLTAAGDRYFDACAPLLEQLREADENARASISPPKGQLVVGVQHIFTNGWLAHELPRFHERYPDIELDIRDVRNVSVEQASGADIMLVLGWPPKIEDWVQKTIGAGRFLVVASPGYWATHSIPQRPSDLEDHSCMPIRALDGTVMDLWSFRRGDEEEAVSAAGWLTTSNAHRELAIAQAVAGMGVLRVIDWATLRELESGTLVQVLQDWESPEAIPVNILYRGSMRRLPRARLLIDYVAESFRQLEARRGGHIDGSEPPRWMRGRYRRSSASLAQPD